jgi:hypothetical protein
MPRADQFLNEFHHDEEFLDEDKFIGKVYTSIIKIAAAPNKSWRHHQTLHLIGKIIEHAIPACDTCGTSIKKLQCDACRRRTEGIFTLNI